MNVQQRIILTLIALHILCVASLYAANPLGAHDTVLVVEDSAYTFSKSDFTFSDADGDSLFALLILTTETDGDMEYAGTDITDSLVCTSISDLTFKPTTDEFGPAYSHITYKLIDSEGDHSDNSYALTIHVSGVNDTATVSNVSIVSNEDSDIQLDQNDFVAAFNDVDGDFPSIITIVSIPPEVTMTLFDSVVSTGDTILFENIESVHINPQEQWNGSTALTWTARDMTLPAKDSAEIQLTITAVNDVPHIDSLTTTMSIPEDTTTITIPVTGLNDGDADVVQLFIQKKVTTPDSLLIEGLVYKQITSDSAVIEFNPVENNSGSTSIRLVLQDDGGVENGGIDSLVKNIVVYVTDINDKPTSSDTTIIILEDTQYYFKHFDFPYQDYEDISHFAKGILLTSLPGNGILRHGTTPVDTGIVYSVLTQFNFIPTANEYGTGYTSFDFRVQDFSDSLSDSSYTITFDVTELNDQPTGDLSASVETVLEDSNYDSVQVTNVTVGEGEPLQTIVSVTAESADTNLIYDVTVVYIVEDDKIIMQYRPRADKWGTTSVRILVKDDGGITDGGVDSTVYTVSVTVTPTADAPVSNDTLLSIPEDYTYLFSYNDFPFNDLDLDTLTKIWITSVPTKGALFYDANDNNFPEPLEVLEAGVIMFKSDFLDEKIKYRPLENENGESYDHIEFRVHDGGIYSDIHDMTLTVVPMNDAPQFETIPTLSGTLEVGNILTGVNGTWNDSIDSDTTTISYLYRWFTAVDTLGTNLDTIGDATESYTISIYDVDQYICFAVYAYDNGVGLGTPHTIAKSSWHLIDNFAPVILEGDTVDAGTISEDNSPIAFDLSLYASDRNGDIVLWAVSNQPVYGIASVVGANDSAVIDYTPNEDYFGPDTFEVVVYDNKGAQNNVIITVDIEPVADAPKVVGGDTLIIMSEDASPTPFTLLMTGKDGDGDLIHWNIIENALYGSATVEGSGSSKQLFYTPNTNFVGLDSFALSVYNSGGADTAWVTVQVDEVDDAPIITEGDTVSTIMDEDANPRGFDVTLHATDDTGGQLTWSTTIPATHGSATVSDVGSAKQLLYTPQLNFYGTDYFTVTVSDAAGNRANAVIKVVVESINDEPQLAPLPDQSIEEGESFATLILDTYVYDVDNTISSLIWTPSSSAHFDISVIDNRRLVVAPLDSNWYGEDSITITVDDQEGGVATRSMLYHITAKNDAPVYTIAPSVVGAPEVDSVLAIDYGIWHDSADGSSSTLSYSHVWQKSNSSYGTSPVSLGSASQLPITSSETHKYIRAVITVSDDESVTGNAATFSTDWVEIDSPVLSLHSIDTLAVLEDSDIYSVTTTGLFSDHDNSDDSIVVSIYSVENDTLALLRILSGNLTVLPLENMFGSTTVVLLAESGGSMVYDTIVVTVQPVDDAPESTLNPKSLIRFEEHTGDTVILSTQFIDVDLDTLSFSFSVSTDSIADIELHNDSLIIHYKENAFGNAWVYITASAHAESVMDSLYIHVNAVADSLTQTTLIPNQMVFEDADTTVIDLSHYFANPDASTILYTVFGCNAELIQCTIVENLLFVSHTLDAFGIDSLSVTASNATNMISQEITYTVITTDDEPRLYFSLDSIKIAEGVQGIVVPLDTLFTDPDSPDSLITLSLVQVSDSTIASVELSDNTMILNGYSNTFGTFDVVLQASSNGLQLQHIITVSVLAVDNPIEVTRSLDTLLLPEGYGTIAIDIQNLFVDIDTHDSLISMVIGNPDSAQLDIILTDDTLYVTPHAEAFGIFDIGLLAETNTTAHVYQTLIIDPINDVPVIRDTTIEISEDSPVKSILARLTFENPDDEEITWTILDPVSAFGIYEGSNMLFQNEVLDMGLRPAYTFRIEASDGEFADTCTVVIQLTRDNNAPVIQDSIYVIKPDAKIYAVVGYVDVYDADVDDILQYRILNNSDFLIGKTGLIQTNRALSNEPYFEFDVEVYDAFRRDTAHIMVIAHDSMFAVTPQSIVIDTFKTAIPILIPGFGTESMLPEVTIGFVDSIKRGSRISHISTYGPEVDHSVLGDETPFIFQGGALYTTETVMSGETYTVMYESVSASFIDTNSFLIHSSEIMTRDTITKVLDTAIVEIDETDVDTLRLDTALVIYDDSEMMSAVAQIDQIVATMNGVIMGVEWSLVQGFEQFYLIDDGLYINTAPTFGSIFRIELFGQKGQNVVLLSLDIRVTRRTAVTPNESVSNIAGHRTQRVGSVVNTFHSPIFQIPQNYSIIEVYTMAGVRIKTLAVNPLEEYNMNEYFDSGVYFIQLK